MRNGYTEEQVAQINARIAAARMRSLVASWGHTCGCWYQTSFLGIRVSPCAEHSQRRPT